MTRKERKGGKEGLEGRNGSIVKENEEEGRKGVMSSVDRYFS